MSEGWVVNASPLILFARVGRLELLERSAPALLIPDAVVEEVRYGKEKDHTAITGLEWSERHRVTDIAIPASIQHWDLGFGESQVNAHATLGQRWALLDDRAARRCAASHNVPVIGSLGVALRCKRCGLIDEARPLLLKLIEAGMYLHERFMKDALKTVGE